MLPPFLEFPPCNIPRFRVGTHRAVVSSQLRGIDAEAGHVGQALHRIVVVSEQLRHLLIELG
jgi:hypothetical protein